MPILTSAEQPHYIPRGLGRSYGDTSINADGGVIDATRLNRMLSFNAEAGILECEGGVSLAEVIETYLPRGWFLPVTPGTKFVTIAGAIANDVHGKNHHRDGSFSNFVLDLVLLTPTGDVRTCSRQSDADIFWATVGGIGLTGIILSARMQLLPVESAYIRADYYRARNLDEALGLMAQYDEKYRYSVAWVDCLAKGKDMGRSVLMYGDHADVSDLPPTITDPFRVRGMLKVPVPFDFPPNVLNPLSIRLFNTAFYAINPTAEGKIIDYDRYFYPLDAIYNWNRIYGRHGFVQFQAVIPSVEGLTKIFQSFT